MAYTPVSTKSTGYLYTAADYNAEIKGNLEAGVPDIFTAKGDLAVASGADAAVPLPVGTNGYALFSDTAATYGIDWEAVGGPYARYKVGGALTINNDTTTIVNYATVVFDSATAVTTGAAWKFTVPAGEDGYYLVCAALEFDSSAAWGAGEYSQLSVFVDGALYGILNQIYAQANGTYAVALHGAMLVFAAAASFIDVRAYQNSGSNLTCPNDGDKIHISIARIF